MFLASAYGAIALNSFTSMFNNATLSIYSGTPPGTAESSLSGNTLLVQYTFSPTAFGTVSTASGFDGQTASFVSSAVSPGNTGTATFGRVDVVPSAWAATTVYVRGAVVSHSSNYYRCVVSGTSASTGPTGTTLGILDGTTAWDYIGPTTAGTTVCQMTVGISGTDIIMASTAIQTGVTATITALSFQIPVN
jgi:hypothetical protein